MSSTPDRTLHPSREDIHGQLEPCSFDVCRRVTPRSRLNQRLVKTSSGPTGARSSSGARLNVPNVNYASGDPARRYRPPSEKVLVRTSSCARQSYILLPRNYKIDRRFLYTLARSCIASSRRTRGPELILSTFHTTEIKISISCEYPIWPPVPPSSDGNFILEVLCDPPATPRVCFEVCCDTVLHRNVISSAARARRVLSLSSAAS